MLTVKENERLTMVGPGTPMGELLRRACVVHGLPPASWCGGAKAGQDPLLSGAAPDR
jgi:hypothetical protein